MLHDIVFRIILHFLGLFIDGDKGILPPPPRAYSRLVEYQVPVSINTRTVSQVLMHKTPGIFSLAPNIGSVTTFRLSLYILQMRILSANNRYRFFTRPLKTNSFYIFSSLFVIKCGSYIIRYTGIYSTKIDICLYAVFFKLRTSICNWGIPDWSMVRFVGKRRQSLLPPFHKP